MKTKEEIVRKALKARVAGSTLMRVNITDLLVALGVEERKAEDAGQPQVEVSPEAEAEPSKPALDGAPDDSEEEDDLDEDEDEDED